MNAEEAKIYISERILVKRKRKGLTIEQLAFKAHVAPGTIKNLEKAKANPTIETLDKIARALDMEIEDICPPKTGIISIDYEALKRLKNK